MVDNIDKAERSIGAAHSQLREVRSLIEQVRHGPVVKDESLKRARGPLDEAKAHIAEALDALQAAWNVAKGGE